jgi:hypothetical protein
MYRETGLKLPGFRPHFRRGGLEANMPLVGHSPNGLGIANGVVVIALLDQMLADGMLRPHQVRRLLNNAIDGLKPLATRSIGVQDALDIIREEMLSRFERDIKED